MHTSQFISNANMQDYNNVETKGSDNGWTCNVCDFHAGDQGLRTVTNLQFAFILLL